MQGAEAIFEIDRLADYLKARFPAAAGAASGEAAVGLAIKLLDKLPAEPGAVIRCSAHGCGKEAPHHIIFEKIPEPRGSAWSCCEHARQMVDALGEKLYAITVTPALTAPPAIPAPEVTYTHYRASGADNEDDALCGDETGDLVRVYSRVTCPKCAELLTGGAT